MVNLRKEAKDWASRSQSSKLSAQQREQLKALLSPALKPLMAITQAGQMVASGQLTQASEELSELDQHVFELLACHYISSHRDNIGKARTVLRERYLEDVKLDALLDGINEQMMGTAPTVAQVGVALEQCYKWYEEYQPILRQTDEGKQQVEALRMAIDQAKERGLLSAVQVKVATRS